MTKSIGQRTPLPTDAPHNLSWWDSVDHMLDDYLVDRGSKVPNELEAKIIKILEPYSAAPEPPPANPSAAEPTNCDPFYNSDADKSRMENGGAYTKEHKEMVVAFVEFGSHRRFDAVISPGVAGSASELSNDMFEFIAAAGAKALIEDHRDYLLLPRVDITKLKKDSNGAAIKEGAIINVGFTNPQNPNVKNLVAKSTKAKSTTVRLPGNLVAVAKSVT
jgi:hypothetical protein